MHYSGPVDMSSHRRTDITQPLDNNLNPPSHLDALKYTARRTVCSPPLPPLSSADRLVDCIATMLERNDDIVYVKQVTTDMNCAVTDRRKDAVKPASDVNGSLLLLASKLHRAEFTVHRKHTNLTPPLTVRPPESVPWCVSHCLGKEGFRFRVEARKRSREVDGSMSELNVKRYCLRDELLSRDSQDVGQNQEDDNIATTPERTSKREGINQYQTIEQEEEGSVTKESISSLEQSTLTSDVHRESSTRLDESSFDSSIQVLKHLYAAIKQATPDHCEQQIPHFSPVRGPPLWPIFSSSRVIDDVEICTFYDKYAESFRIQNHRFRHHADRYTSTPTEEKIDFIVEMGITNVIVSQRSLLANGVIAALRRFNLSELCSRAPSEATTRASACVTKEYTGPSLSSSLRRFICDRCPYHTDNKSHLVRHKNSIHLTHRPFPCYVCLKPFSRAENVRAHFRSAHPLSTFNPDLVQMASVALVVYIYNRS